jgi:hypothetical protein
MGKKSKNVAKLRKKDDKENKARSNKASATTGVATSKGSGLHTKIRKRAFEFVTKEGDDRGVLYSTSEYLKGRPELIAFIPASRKKEIQNIMESLCSRTLNDGDKVEQKGFYLVAYKVKEKGRPPMLTKHMNHANKDAEVMIIAPRFKNGDSLQHWGRLPPTPDGKDDRAHDIVQKWKHQKRFVRFLDGNTKNFDSDNLVFLEGGVVDALKHQEWTTNWNETLNFREIEYVETRWNYFASVMKALRDMPGEISVDSKFPALENVPPTGRPDDDTD